MNEDHARRRLELERWILNKNQLRAKAIMRGINPSDFMLENEIVRPSKVSFLSKEKVAKPKRLSKKPKKFKQS